MKNVKKSFFRVAFHGIVVGALSISASSALAGKVKGSTSVDAQTQGHAAGVTTNTGEASQRAGQARSGSVDPGLAKSGLGSLRSKVKGQDGKAVGSVGGSRQTDPLEIAKMALRFNLPFANHQTKYAQNYVLGKISAVDPEGAKTVASLFQQTDQRIGDKELAAEYLAQLLKKIEDAKAVTPDLVKNHTEQFAKDNNLQDLTEENIKSLCGKKG